MQNQIRGERGWVLYDGSCAICRRGAMRFGPLLQRRGFQMAALQSAVGRSYALDGKDEMKVVTGDGRILGGAEGIAYLCQWIWWARPLQWLWRAGPMRPRLERMYRWIAAHRHCGVEGCHGGEGDSRRW